MQLDPKKTALVLIEFQNDFTTEGGVFHAAVKGVMDANQMLANTTATVQEAREAGIQVLHVPISFTQDYRELTGKPYGILKGVVDNGAFRKNTWGAAIVDQLSPQQTDIVVEGKRGLCGFASTNLDFILRSRGIPVLPTCRSSLSCRSF